MPSLRDQLLARLAFELRFVNQQTLGQALAYSGREGLLGVLKSRSLISQEQLAEISRRRSTIHFHCDKCNGTFSEMNMPASDFFPCPHCNNQITDLFRLRISWGQSQQNNQAGNQGQLKTWMPKNVPYLNNYNNSGNGPQVTQVNPSVQTGRPHTGRYAPSTGSYQNPGSGQYPSNPQTGSYSRNQLQNQQRPGSGQYPSQGYNQGHPNTGRYAPNTGRYNPQPQNNQHPNTGRFGSGVQPGFGQQGTSNQGHGNQGHGNQGHGNQGHGNQGHGNQGHGNQGQAGSARVPKKVGHQQLVGTVLGGFKLDQFLGKGAHGWVFKASHPRANFPLAVKVVPQAVAQKNPVIIKRLEREATILKGVNHKNLIRTFGYGHEQGYVFMAMEFVRGTTLGDVIAEWETPQIDQGLSLFRQVLEGLAAAHQRGVIHRDLKPDNIMISEEGVVKIMDFGLAREDDYNDDSGPALTMQGEILGTPHYMSPEQAEAEEIDHRADIYAAGATFYHVFAGSVPFSDKRVVKIIRAHLKKKPQPPRERNPEIPELLEQVLLNMLEKKPDTRPQNCAQIVKDLEPLGQGTTVKAPTDNQELDFPEPAYLILLKDGVSEGWLSEDRVISALDQSNKIARSPQILKNSGYTPPDMERRINQAQTTYRQRLNEIEARITVESGILPQNVLDKEMKQPSDKSFAERQLSAGQLNQATAKNLEETAADYHHLLEDMILGKMCVRKNILSEQLYLQLIRKRNPKTRFDTGLEEAGVTKEDIVATKKDAIRYMLKKPLPNLKPPRIKPS